LLKLNDDDDDDDTRKTTQAEILTDGRQQVPMLDAKCSAN